MADKGQKPDFDVKTEDKKNDLKLDVCKNVLKYNLFFSFLYIFLQKQNVEQRRQSIGISFSKSRLIKVLNDGQSLGQKDFQFKEFF